MNSAADVWEKVKTLMEADMTSVSIDTWFGDAQAVALEDTRFLLCVSTDFKRDVYKRQQISYRFQQIGLSLGVVSKDDVDPRMKSRLQVEVVPKKIQGNGFDNHSTTRAICPPSSTRSPGRSFFPRMVHT